MFSVPSGMGHHSQKGHRLVTAVALTLRAIRL
jgi:hypothetical protein